MVLSRNSCAKYATGASGNRPWSEQERRAYLAGQVCERWC